MDFLDGMWSKEGIHLTGTGGLPADIRHRHGASGEQQDRHARPSNGIVSVTNKDSGNFGDRSSHDSPFKKHSLPTRRP
jgi:hypothetical protein